MLLQTWSQVLTASFQNLWAGVIMYIPLIVVSIVILVVGWAFGTIVGKWVAQVVRALKLDRALESLGVSDLTTRAGWRLDSGKFIGELVKWFVIVTFLVAAIDVLGLNQVNIFLQQVVLGYIPNVIVAAFILLAAAVLADFLQKFVTGSARAGDIPHAELFGGIAKWAVWIFAFVAAMSQLGIAGQLFYTLFTGVVAMLALAGGLAFGLGGRDAAARYLDKLHKDISR